MGNFNDLPQDQEQDLSITPEVAVSPTQPVEQPVTPLKVNVEPVVQTVTQPSSSELPVADAPQPMQPPVANSPEADNPPAAPTAEPVAPSDEITIDASGQISEYDPEPNASPQPAPADPIANSNESNSELTENQAANVEALTQAINNLSDEAAQQSADNATKEPVAVDDGSQSSPISGKKIIRPLDQQPERSLDELLAIEEASQPQAPPVAPQPVVMEPHSPFDPSDPNNIAL